MIVSLVYLANPAITPLWSRGRNIIDKRIDTNYYSVYNVIYNVVCHNIFLYRNVNRINVEYIK